VLHKNGITEVETPPRPPRPETRCRPLRVPPLFAIGIIGTGLLAVPVLAGSAAYAVGEALRWPTGLDRKPLAPRALRLLAVATLLGLAINFPQVQKVTHLSPIRALYWSAVINGVIAVPVMVVVCSCTKTKRSWPVQSAFSRRLRNRRLARHAVMPWLPPGCSSPGKR